ncbi:MAG: hypothetical protein LBM93_15715 [Oscillospiraceae bacterium]|nr:hypothetical protein [Oscillospiraceae bacterium]
MKKLKGNTFAYAMVFPAVVAVLGAVLVPAMIGWTAKAEARTLSSGAKQVYVNAQAIAQEYEEKQDFALKTIYKSSGNDELPSGITFQEEMERKFADSADVEWCVVFSTESSSVLDAGTCVAAVYGENYEYGTYPENDSLGYYDSLEDAAYSAAKIYIEDWADGEGENSIDWDAIK